MAVVLFRYSLFHLTPHYVALLKNNLCWTLLTHEPQYDDAGVDYVAGYFAVFYLAMTSQKTGINEPFWWSIKNKEQCKVDVAKG